MPQVCPLRKNEDLLISWQLSTWQCWRFSSPVPEVDMDTVRRGYEPRDELKFCLRSFQIMAGAPDGFAVAPELLNRFQ